ncbi:MAG: selenide, water dikinase SelD [Alphaproteobacteria bacterium]
MHPSAVPVVKDIVLVGGGHAHVAVLKSFGMRPMPGARLTLIARDVETPYSGMLPGLVAGHYSRDEAHIDLRPLARFAGARLYHDTAIGLDLAGQRVLCAERPPVAYDLLSLDIGSTPDMRGFPGAAENVTPVKPIDRFLDRWHAVEERVLAARGPQRIGVAGGGAGGTELILAVRHRLLDCFARAGRSSEGLSFHIVTDHGVLPDAPAYTRRAFDRVLAARNVEVHTGCRIEGAGPGRLLCGDGRNIDLDEILWVMPAGTAAWPGDAGLACDPGGFVRVDASLRSVSHPAVFAVGDMANVVGHKRPKAGVFAVRQGPPLAASLRRALAGEEPRPFHPQRRFLSIISTGDKCAVATRGAVTVEGRWVWRAKDWIDRRWMAKYKHLPAMSEASPPAPAAGVADAEALAVIAQAAMRCGGCGAKVGSAVLERALANLSPVRRDDVLCGLDAPDDAALLAVPPGKAMVQSVDYFRAILDDPYLFGRIAANHALGDLYAMGAEPQSALAIVTLPYGPEAQVERQLADLMAGASATLAEAGAALAGGHTGEGVEMALGFVVNGLADPAAILRKGGLRTGDALILTKPLGTGTLFAADMRGRAKGVWIDAAVDSMLVSSSLAAAVLRDHGATACTDVTGFGLLGHLTEMLKASGRAAVLDLGALPVLPGAAETVAAGLFSSLQPANLRLRRILSNPERVAGNPLYPLLFDPQTAGGLLAGVPAARAEPCIAALRAAGYAAAAMIGRVEDAGGAPEIVTVQG